MYRYYYNSYDDSTQQSIPGNRGSIESSLSPRLQTSNTFLRICADPRRTNCFFVLFLSQFLQIARPLISVTWNPKPQPLLAQPLLLISLDSQFLLCWYFSHFSISFFITLLSPGTPMCTMIVSLVFLFAITISGLRKWIISNRVNYKMLDYYWLSTALIYGLIGCFRSKLSDLTCPITDICNRTGQIG